MIFIALISCDSGKSVSKDLITGLTTHGDGLSCEDVYLSDGEKGINRNTFTYGEIVYINFENIEGFKKNGENVFSGMKLYVLNQSEDTVLIYPNLYAEYQDGINISPLILQANLTFADPIHSDEEYTLHIDIWDKNGDGTFVASMDFDVNHDEQIMIDNENLSYKEVYLFSEGENKVLTQSTANYNENIYLIFEGLEGFVEENGMVFIGLGLKVMDSVGELIINKEDLIGDSGLESSQVKERLFPSFIISDTIISNPVTYEITIWDKKGENKITASVDLTLK
ncbi:MAG TPA: hypothetical protein DEQ09_02520 [Bacteroidales bacterium]|nr:hypothetical protein [Bacteroidales bacterium]